MCAASEKSLSAFEMALMDVGRFQTHIITVLSPKIYSTCEHAFTRDMHAFGLTKVSDHCSKNLEEKLVAYKFQSHCATETVSKADRYRTIFTILRQETQSFSMPLWLKPYIVSL
jgi:hypothetical protein